MKNRNTIAALALLAAFTVACNDEAPLTTGPADQAPAVTQGDATQHPMNERTSAVASLAALGGIGACTKRCVRSSTARRTVG